MPTLTITKSYADGLALTESMLDEFKNDVEAFLNSTKIDADNIQSAAITSGLIASGAVTAGKLGSSAVTTAKIADGAVTNSKLAALGQQTSSGTGASATVTGTTYTDVTNLTVSITTTGRPVVVVLVAEDTTNTSQIYVNRSDSGTNVRGFIKILRDATTVSIQESDHTFNSSSSSILHGIPVGSVFHIDAPTAATYTYKVQAKTGGASQTITFERVKLMAYEIM